MASYSKADGSVQSQVNGLLALYHAELVENGVTVQVLMAQAARDEAGQPKGPALRGLYGYPVAVQARINSLRDRVEGKRDATLILDGDRWDEWPEAEQFGILDHGLESLELRLDEDAKVILDDALRPKLRHRVHDVQIGAYLACADRHGEASLEVRAMRKAIEDHDGKLLPELKTAQSEVA